ncbi:putative RNA recognition motif domain-containing protein [Lupinus albus]|uniref:Putative RNA recognition motif domain-containing protein n=1 Tax=Lupinus albus TaxID=3870 RepID=A0A6A4QPN9_LUPAL|nr:putative RNA recognition motif domain-containing protein [Lupinus albus]
MAKKRKLRSSDPEPEPQDIQDHQTLEGAQDHVPVEEENPEVEQQRDEDEDEDEDETLEDKEQDTEPSKDDDAADATASESTKVEVNGLEEEEEEEEEEDLDLEDEPVEKLLEPFTKEQLHALVKQAVEKYPDFVENVRQLADQPQKNIGNRTTSCQLASAGPVPAPPPVTPAVSEYTQRKIFVSNVSADIDPQKLLEFFRQFGEVEDGPLGLDKQTGKPKGFALFVYKSVDSAKKALEDPHKPFEGHVLYCQKAVDGPKGKPGYHQQPHHQHHQHQHYSQHHHQTHYQRKEKNRYSSGGPPHGGGGHLMAPSGPAVGGYNTGVPAAQGLNPVLGQAISALLTTQGAGLGFGNLLGGLAGAPVNQSVPQAGYGNQPAMNYGNQQVMPQGYQNPQMGQSSGVRPHPGAGAPYMGH